MMVMVTQVVKNEVENMFKHINKNITLIRSMHYYHPWLNLNAYYSRPENEISINCISYDPPPHINVIFTLKTILQFCLHPFYKILYIM